MHWLGTVFVRYFGEYAKIRRVTQYFVITNGDSIPFVYGSTTGIPDGNYTVTGNINQNITEFYSGSWHLALAQLSSTPRTYTVQSINNWRIEDGGAAAFDHTAIFTSE